MYRVLAGYSGAVVMLMESETKEDAENFMKYPFTICYKDETDYLDEDEVIYPNEMWLTEENVPFEYAPSPAELCKMIGDELPF